MKKDKGAHVGSLPAGARILLKMKDLTLQGKVIRHSVGQTTVKWDDGANVGISPNTIVVLKEE